MSSPDADARAARPAEPGSRSGPSGTRSGSAGSRSGSSGTRSGSSGGPSEWSGTYSAETLRAHTHARTRAPRSLARALEHLTAELAPISLLGRVQTVWERATGPTIAASASPVAEREGVLTVACESSVWAHELEMLAPELIETLNTELGSEEVVRLRCRTA